MGHSVRTTGLLAVVGLYLLLCLLTWNRIEEDAYTYFRLAENIAASEGYVFNRGGPPITHRDAEAQLPGLSRMRRSRSRWRLLAMRLGRERQQRRQPQLRDREDPASEVHDPAVSEILSVKLEQSLPLTRLLPARERCR